MDYEAQLNFLRNALSKMNVNSYIVDPAVKVDEGVDMGLRRVLYKEEEPHSLESLFKAAEPNVIYRYTDAFYCKYIYFVLPEIKPALVFVAGPVLYTEITHQFLLELGEKHNLPPTAINQLKLYYMNIGNMPENNQLLILIDTLAECMWGKENYSFNEQSDTEGDFVSVAQKDIGYISQGLDMKVMEARYAFENQLMDAVTHGQIHKAEMLFSNFGELHFDQRIADSLRNLKNYSIICNTLLRKAAEKGGVHPIHLDSTSSSFARKIESTPSVSEIAPLMKDMFNAYCRLVKKHSIKQFSAPVQKAVTTICADLTADLSLCRLADMQGISSGYLSALFKKETGQTVTDFVSQKRMQYAVQLLGETTLQVQTVAQHCGFLDVHYFSKVFKKYVGKTPKEYRQDAHTKQH